MISLHVADSFCQFLHQVSKFQGMRTMLGVFCPGLLDSCAPSTVTSSFSGVCGNHTGRTREIRRHTPGVQVLFEKVTKADLPEVSTCIYYIIPIDWIRYSLGTQNPKRPQKRGLHCTQTAAEDRCWSRGQQHLFAAGISFKELLLEGSMTQTAGNLIFRVELQCPTSALV